MEFVPLVSFPKSGNTWMRFLLANALKRDPGYAVDYRSINEITPTSPQGDLVRAACLCVDGTPVFVKNHSSYDRVGYGGFSRAIYVYRNGLDVLHSYWRFTCAQAPGLFASQLQFARCYWWYCGHWGDHVSSWLHPASPGPVAVHAVRYEELLSSTAEVLRRLLCFLGVEVDDDRIEAAVSLSDRRSMRALAGGAEFMRSRSRDAQFVGGTGAEGDRMLDPRARLSFVRYAPNYRMLLDLGYLPEDNEWADLAKSERQPRADRRLYAFRRLRYNIARRLHATPPAHDQT